MNNLAYYRDLAGLNQRELADLVGVTQPTVQRAESEHASAKLSTYKDCADALGVTLAQIFSDRSEIEERVLSIFRRHADDAHSERLLKILEAAESLPQASSE